MLETNHKVMFGMVSSLFVEVISFAMLSICGMLFIIAILWLVYFFLLISFFFLNFYLTLPVSIYTVAPPNEVLSDEF